jgi:hypothetical protein
MIPNDGSCAKKAVWDGMITPPHPAIRFRRKLLRQEELALSTVTARRFCDQQEMSLHTATGRSLP